MDRASCKGVFDNIVAWNINSRLLYVRCLKGNYTCVMSVCFPQVDNSNYSSSDFDAISTNINISKTLSRSKRILAIFGLFIGHWCFQVLFGFMIKLFLPSRNAWKLYTWFIISCTKWSKKKPLKVMKLFFIIVKSRNYKTCLTELP